MGNFVFILLLVLACTWVGAEIFSRISGETNRQFLFGYTSQAMISLGLACTVFASGMWLALPKHTPRREIVFSYLMSRSRNPSGHLYASLGLFFCAIFLIPVASRFRYAFPRSFGSHAAAALLVIGIVGLSFMGIFSLVVDKLGVFHDDVTLISGLGILDGMLLYAGQVCRTGYARAKVMAIAMVLSLLGMLTLLFYVAANPAYTDSPNAGWHSLAIMEWFGVTYIAFHLFLLILLSSASRK